MRNLLHGVALLVGGGILAVVAMGESPEHGAAQVTIERGRGPVVNEGGWKERSQPEWIVVRDPAMPVSLVGLKGVECARDTPYPSQYMAAFEVAATRPVAAVDVWFLTTNVWGEMTRVLSASATKRIPPGASVKSNRLYWTVQRSSGVPESYVEGMEIYASIAFVARVRTVDGQVVVASSDVLQAAADEVKRYTGAAPTKQLTIDSRTPDARSYW